MAKKNTAVKPSVKKQKRGQRVNIEVDKVAMTAAALGTYLIATEVSAAEDDKLSAQALQEQNLLQAQLDQDLQLDPAALAVPELPSDLAELLGGNPPAEDLASDLLSPEFSQAASNLPVADLDGTMLSAASPDATIAPGVDGKTVMSDAGSASGSAGSAAGSAADSGAAAGSAAGGGAAGSMPALGALSSIPAGVIAGAVGVAAAAAGGGGGGGGGLASNITSVAKGMVVDGNVRGATVFYDANANGKLDAGEKFTTTGNDGSYTLNGYTSTDVGQIVVLAGGVDVLTGQTVGMMVTPHGYTNVNPLTTLLAASPGVTEAQLKAKLGIDPGIDLNNYDPLADMQDPLKAAAAQKAFTVAQQVYAVLQTAAGLQAKTTDGTVDPADITAIAQKLMDGIMSGSGDSTAILQQATQSTVAMAANGNTALQDSVTAALTTVTSAIETSYQNLAANLQSGDSSGIANSVSVAAVSQSALLDAVSSGNTNTLNVLSNSSSLQNLANSYSSSIANNISNGGTGTVTITAPTVYTVAEAGAAGGSLPAKYTIVDQVSNIANYLSVPGSHTLVTGAIGVIAQSSSPINVQDVLDIIGNVPGASFEQKNLALASGNSMSLSVEAANLLADRYMKFASGNDITVQFTPSTELASIVSHAQKLGNLGVDTLVPTTDFVISVSDATAIVVNGHMVFESSAHIGMQVSQSDLATALATADGAQALAHAGIDYLASSGSLNITVDQAAHLLDAGLQLDAAHPGTLITDDTSHIDATSLDNLMAAHIQTLGSSLDTHALATSDHFASQMVVDGLHFATGADVSLGLATVAGATHMETSLKQLQHLGVDNVGVLGHTGNVFVDLGSGSWGTGALPHFATGDTVDLMFNNSQIDELITHKADLVGANIDELHTTDVHGNVTLTVDQADGLLGGDGTFNVGADLAFNTGNNVTLTVDNDADAISHVAGESAALHRLGVDQIDIDGAGVNVSITDAQAHDLVMGGLAFSTDDHIALGAADGTHLQTSLQQLQHLGVDSISVAGGGELTINLGDISQIDFNNLPTFAAGDHVTLSIHGADGDALFEHLSQLHAANIDTLFVDDSNVLIPLDGAAELLSNHLQISSGNDFTLEVANGADLPGVVHDLTNYQLLGVDHISVDQGSATINDTAARALVHAGIDFAPANNVALNVSNANGNHLSSTLKDLQNLPVDTVTASSTNLTVDLGPGTWDTDPLPNFADALNVTLNVGAGHIGQIGSGNHYNALHSHGIDKIQVHGTEDQLSALNGTDVANAHVSGFTLDMTDTDFANLVNDIHDGLPTVGTVSVNTIDVSGVAGNAGQLHVDTDTAQAMIQAGLHFEAADHIMLDVQAGANGTSFATNANTLHQLGVDAVTVHVDDSGPMDLSQLSHFDDSLNVTLDVSEMSDENQPNGDAETGALLRSLGFDAIEINADINGLSDQLLGLLNNDQDGALDIIHGVMGMQVAVDLQGTSSGGPANLDAGIFSLVGDLNTLHGTNSDLISALHDSGISDLTVERGSTQVSDGLLAALADSGMLHAVSDANLMVDATQSDHHMFTSLKNLADLGVDHVQANTSGNLYINLGELGQIGAMAEVKAILSHLGNDIFSGADTPTLVLDVRTASALLGNDGKFDSSIMQGLEQIGIKEVAVLVGHNESTNIVAQNPTVNAPEVKLIGQDADPALYDDLHHPRH